MAGRTSRATRKQLGSWLMFKAEDSNEGGYSFQVRSWETP